MKFYVVIVGIIVVAMTVATIVVGAWSFDGTVVDKPYEAGLAFDAERQNHLALGWSVALSREEFSVGPNQLVVQALDRDHRPLAGASVTVTVSRPSTNSYDKSYQALPQQAGDYLAMASLPLPGTWDIGIDVSVGDKRTSFAETIYAQ
jgi:nitrogen fixation protein FixH